MAQQLNLTDIGPIRELQIPIPEDGGVVVLRGRNGCGKTHALAATAALVTGKGVSDVAARDGAVVGGKVEGFGARISVKRRSKRSGELEVLHLESAVDPSVLVDPGIKDPEAADARRIKALVALSGAALSTDRFRELSPRFDDVVKAGSVTNDPLETARNVKRDFEAAARIEESRRDECEAKAKMLTESVGEFPEGYVHDAEALANATEAAVRALAEAEGEVRQAEKHNQAAAEAKKWLSEIEAPDVARRENILADRTLVMESAARGVAELREMLANAEKELDRARSDVRSAQESLENERQLAETIARAERVVKIADDFVYPNSTQISCLRQALDNARRNEERGREIREAMRKVFEADMATSEAKESHKRAEHLREAGKAADDILSEAVQAAGTGLRVYQGRLVTETDRSSDTLFCELSEGQRWRMALDIAIGRVGRGGLLVVPQDAWQDLDVDNRAAIAAQVKEAGVVVLTAEAEDGELRAEEVL